MKNTTSIKTEQNQVSKEELIAKLTAKAQPGEAPVCVPHCVG